jgi:hypothetical protein
MRFVGKFVLVLLVVCVTGVLFGQGVHVFEFRGGYLNPKDVDGSFVLSGNYGIAVDERVDITLGFSYFNKRSEKTIEVAETVQDGVVITTKQQETEYNNTLLPISADLTINFPFQPPLYWFIGGGVSYQFLFVKSTTFSGFGWQTRTGIMYNIGSKSSIILEAVYNSCKPKGNKEKKEGGLIWDEVNVSGLGFRAGIRLEFF